MTDAAVPQIIRYRQARGTYVHDVYMDGLRIGRFRRYEYGAGYVLLPAYFCGGQERAVTKGGALTRTKRQAIDRLVLMYQEAIAYATNHEIRIERDQSRPGEVALLRNGARFEMSQGDYCRLMNSLMEIEESRNPQAVRS